MPDTLSSHELTIRVGGEILRVEAAGKRTAGSVAAISREIMALCREHGTPKALVDVRRLEGRLTSIDAFFLVTRHFAAIRDLRFLRQAAVLDREYTEKRHQFFETVAVNRGYNVRIFVDEAEAVAWLSA